MMTSPRPLSQSTPAPDRLSVAAGLLAGFLVVSALSALILLITPHTRFIETNERAARLVDTLHLSHLALWPSGRPLRAPEFSHPAVVLRPSPWVPFPEPGLEWLANCPPGPGPTTNGRVRP